MIFTIHTETTAHLPLRDLSVEPLLELPRLLLQPVPQLPGLPLAVRHLLVQPLPEIIVVTQEQEQHLLDLLGRVDYLALGRLIVWSHLYAVPRQPPLARLGTCSVFIYKYVSPLIRATADWRLVRAEAA